MVKQWPKQERPREKLLHQGSGALSDSELLAIILRTGVKGKSVVSLARDLLQEFGGLRPLMQANFEDASQIKGLGPAKFAQLCAVLEIAKRYLFAEMQQLGTISNPEQATDYLLMTMRDYDAEVFACLLLDSRNRVLLYQELFRGSINSTSVYPREVLKLVIQENAAAVIFAHNHPSGDATPSEADREITQRLKRALALIDVKVLDHLVIGEKVSSLMNLGYL